jgi:hypothetical protein
MWLCRQKELLHFELHIHLQGQYSIPFPFWHSEKLALFCNLDFTEVFINFEKYVIHYKNFMSNLFIGIYSDGGWGGMSSWNI